MPDFGTLEQAGPNGLLAFIPFSPIALDEEESALADELALVVEDIAELDPLEESPLPHAPSESAPAVARTSAVALDFMIFSSVR
ncbi:hypothetical protein GCM10009762_01240 [Dermacoccus barathri]|uniref:Uncharacterized protein n=1 Tax=Dermacoccus barathri TaxID=322601 RepID=A0ABN2B0N5_9MICO